MGRFLGEDGEISEEMFTQIHWKNDLKCGRAR